jgi:4-carboxymuconolactone decarboxylase
VTRHFYARTNFVEGKKLTVITDIGMLIALKSWPELGVHTRGAINNGVTEVEIREAILQAAIYCGVPAGIEATKVASATIDDMVANGEHTRELAEGL